MTRGEYVRDSRMRVETRSCNNRLQLTGISSPVPLISGQEAVQLQYTYSTTNNNGQIQSMTNAVSGETVTYAYDELRRLKSAAARVGRKGIPMTDSGICMQRVGPD